MKNATEKSPLVREKNRCLRGFLTISIESQNENELTEE
jgi:hypothetical protein